MYAQKVAFNLIYPLVQLTMQLVYRIQYMEVQHSTTLSNTEQHSTTQYCKRITTLCNTTQYNVAPHSSGHVSQHCATQHSTSQHNIAPHSTAQHSTAPHCALPETPQQCLLSTVCIAAHQQKCVPCVGTQAKYLRVWDAIVVDKPLKRIGIYKQDTILRSIRPL